MKHIAEFFGWAVSYVAGAENLPPCPVHLSPAYTETITFITEAHSHQYDSATRTPYYTHPLRVSEIYMNLKPDYTADEVLAALLHDVLEDGRIGDVIEGKRDVTEIDLEIRGYSAKTIDMVKAVSKPRRKGKDERTREEKLIDNRAYIKTLCATGTLEDKLLKFCDALSNRERQALESQVSTNRELMDYRIQKTDDTLNILYLELKDYFDELGYQNLGEIVHDMISSDNHFIPIPSFPEEGEIVAAEPLAERSS